MDLEKLAVEWVQKCKFEHPNTTKHKMYANLGQNLALGENMRLYWPWALQGWLDEGKNYNFSENKCKETYECGHYTQVIFLC